MSWTTESRRAYRARNLERIREAERARKRSYGRPCLDCGKTTDGSNGRAKAPERCVTCANRARTVWTPEAIAAAMQLYAHRYGRPPSAPDWNPSHARSIGRDDWADRFYADGDYPHGHTVQSVFGSWNAGIEAAGFDPRGIGKRGPARPRMEAS